MQPADLQPGEIEARLGSSWIPASDIRDFVAQLLDNTPDTVRIAHAKAIATWTVEIDAPARAVTVPRLTPKAKRSGIRENCSVLVEPLKNQPGRVEDGLCGP